MKANTNKAKKTPVGLYEMMIILDKCTCINFGLKTLEIL